MNTQTFAKTTTTCSIFSLPVYIPISTTSITAKEIGYEIDEDDLAREMLAPLPTSLQDQPAPQVDPDEFDKIYKWFLS